MEGDQNVENANENKGVNIVALGDKRQLLAPIQNLVN
jgi:hypothetical protein